MPKLKRFTQTVNQFIIFDAYKKDYDEKNKQKKQQKEDNNINYYSKSFKNNLIIMERMII